MVERFPFGHHLRAWLPVKTYPVSAGVKGGLAGSVAMAVLACAYGVLKAGSIWYPDQSSCRSRVRRIAEARARHSCIHFMRTASRLLWSSTSSCLRWSDCSMARCFPCSRAVRSCLED